MSLKNAMKQSCDTYFYEVARLLGVDRLKVTAEKFGLGKKVLGDYFVEGGDVPIDSHDWWTRGAGDNAACEVSGAGAR